MRKVSDLSVVVITKYSKLLDQTDMEVGDGACGGTTQPFIRSLFHFLLFLILDYHKLNYDTLFIDMP